MWMSKNMLMALLLVLSRFYEVMYATTNVKARQVGLYKYPILTPISM